ncbi:hypothetical protein BCR36DRAFT_322619 [Piromyces finnis]|uniref:CBM10 domain-containing protein n=1 Tax=Piromyces finnis TaxID=1754191 RepID=A0A1Y1VEK2_9FUNG|nr:hypothetical protein BCR36DRAFT_322619 [Piromyces finnis]|eukprot:ORX54247.1 hypothetical protein BCR36DRAFT_322619 [Piromyces finnis]
MKYIHTLGLLLASTLIVSNVEAAYPKCSDCIVFATGKDGSLWGWENESFCRISKKCYSTTTKKVKTSTKKTTKKTTTKKLTTKKLTTKKTKVTANVATEVAPTTTIPATIPPAPIKTSGPHQTNARGQMICNACTVTATGGDNSLWGYEDDKSCVIDEVRCNVKSATETAPPPNDVALANHQKDGSGNLICNGCNVTETGGDQSLWGYEDNASCIIDRVKCKLEAPKKNKDDGIPICDTCVALETHSDTTLWNYENGKACRVIGSRCNINSTPYSWCKGCVVTEYGGDGAAFGWENEQSCLVNEQSCGYVDKFGKPFGEAVDESGDAYSQKIGMGIAITSLIGLIIAIAF